MNDIILKDISSMIYEARNKYVILDSDLAKLFGVETRVLNQTVKRNCEKFDNNVYFRITESEYINLKLVLSTSRDDLKSQFVTSSLENNYGGSRKGHTVFTREGVSILSSIMRSDRVKEVTKEILYEFDKLENENSLIIKGHNIKSMIYEIRGKQVILDSDLAYLYQCKNGTKEINQAVKNNLDKFPSNYVFQLTKDECERLSRSKVLTLNEGRGHNIKYLPYVFTEQGVVMLATILHTKIAIETSIMIIDAFVVMKHYLTEHGDIYKSINHLNNKVIEHDEKIDLLLSEFNPKERLYLAGKTFEAYYDIIDIFKKAKKELIIIDGYVDRSMLNYIKEIKSNIIIITKTNSKLSDFDIQKYNDEYHNLRLVYNDKIHDRYFIIDKKDIYHCGTSINKLEDKFIIDTILKEIKIV